MRPGIAPRHVMYRAIQEAMPFAAWVDIEDVKLAAIPAVSPLDALERGERERAKSLLNAERQRNAKLAAGRVIKHGGKHPEPTEDDLIRTGARTIVTQALQHLVKYRLVERDGQRVRRLADFASLGVPTLRLVQGGEAATG